MVTRGNVGRRVSPGRTAGRRSGPAARTKPSRRHTPRATIVRVQNTDLRLSNLDKVLYRSSGTTKAEVIDYYRRISPILLPHVARRPLTLKRYPEGTEESYFYEKQCPAHRPEWVATYSVWSESRRRTVNFCVIDGLASLIWVANLASLELHVALSRAESIDRPDMMVLDLDPGPGTDILSCAAVAFELRDLLHELGLECFVKTSGLKGLHVVVQLNGDADYAATKSAAKALAGEVQRAQPELAVANMRKTFRQGRVLIDWSQNDLHKTTVCVYSLRAGRRPTVSTPVTWDELQHAMAEDDPSMLMFGADDVLKRIDRHGDLFKPVLTMVQRLPETARL